MPILLGQQFSFISVIQESNLSVSPEGIGVTVAVGEILDPVNKLVQRFSWVMLARTTSIGVQMILVEIGSWLGFNILLNHIVSLIVIFVLPRLLSKLQLSFHR